MTVKRRPIGVTILAILYLATAGVWLASLLTRGGGLAILSIALVAILLAVGYGTWTLKPWAWTVGLMLSILNIISPIPSSLNDPMLLLTSVFWIAISVLTIWYLNSAPVRAAFGRGSFRPG